MSKVDLVLGLLVLVGAYGGYRDGFLMGLVTMAALVLGIFGAFKLMGAGMLFLQDEFNADKTILPYLSFFLIFVIIVILVNWLGRSIRHMIDKTFLGRVDEIMGSLLGAFKMTFILSIALWIADSFKYELRAEWTEGSVLYPFTARLAPDLAGWIAQFLPFLREIFPEF